MTSRSNGNAFVAGAEDLRFKSLADQIETSVANGWSPLRFFCKRSCVFRRNGLRKFVTRFRVILFFDVQNAVTKKSSRFNIYSFCCCYSSLR